MGRRRSVPVWTLGMAASLLIFFSESSAQGRVPVPEFYGIYLVSDGKLISPSKSELNTVGILAGIKKLSGLSVSSNTYLLLYGKEMGKILYRLKLVRLVYARTVEQRRVSVIFAPGDAKKSVEVNMWIQGDDVPLNIGPVKDHVDLYKLLPTARLSNGAYLLYVEMGGPVADFAVGRVDATAAQEPSVGSKPTSPPEVGRPGASAERTPGRQPAAGAPLAAVTRA